MRISRPLFALAALALLGGCAYQLGPTNGVAAGSKSVNVTPFLNRTLQPRLGDEVTASLRRTLQRDGTYRLSTHGESDIVVTGVVTKYDRHELSFVPSDVLTVRDFRIGITAQVKAKDVGSGKTLFDRQVTGYTLVRVGSDITSAERQAMPLLADDLAKHVADMLVDGSW